MGDKTSPLVPPPLLIFLHLGKTAGATFNDAFVHQFPQDQRFHAYRGPHSAMGHYHLEVIARAFAEEVGDLAHQIRLVSGHVSFGIHRLFAKPAKYLTFVRDPVDRLVSGYYYMKSIDLSNTVWQLPYSRLSLHEMMASRISTGLHNYQTRALCGRPELDVLEPTGRDLDFPPVSREHLEEAKANIRDHFLLAAPTGEIDRVISILARIYGFSLEKMACPPRNVTPARPRLREVPQKTLDLIAANNRYDLELFAHVRKEFAAFKQRLPFDLESDVKRLQALRPDAGRSSTPLRPWLRGLGFVNKTLGKLFRRTG